MKEFKADMTLEEAIYETAHHSDKPLKLIASEIGMTPTHLTRAALPDDPANFPADKIDPIIKSTGKYLILDVLEYGVGRFGIQLPKKIKEKSTKDICMLTMLATQEFGKLAGEVKKSIEDDVLKKDECNRILAEGYKTCQVILSLMTAVKGKGEL